MSPMATEFSTCLLPITMLTVFADFFTPTIPFARGVISAILPIQMVGYNRSLWLLGKPCFALSCTISRNSTPFEIAAATASLFFSISKICCLPLPCGQIFHNNCKSLGIALCCCFHQSFCYCCCSGCFPLMIYHPL